MKYEVTTTTTRTGVMEVDDKLMATFTEDEKHDYIVERIQEMEDEQLLDFLDDDCDWQEADEDDTANLDAETIAVYNARMALRKANMEEWLAEQEVFLAE